MNTPTDSIKIKVVIPNSGMESETLRMRETMLTKAVSKGTQISVECIPFGPEAIESETDEILAAPYLLEAAQKAEKDGYHAFVVYCFSDLSVDALRENLQIPIVGPGEVAIAAAQMLSNRFTVVTTTEKNVPRTIRRLEKNPIVRLKMAGVREIGIPVSDLREKPEVTMRCLKEVCRHAVEEDGADVVILGCLGMAEYGGELEKEFGIKVIDPAFLAVAWAEVSVRLGLIPSRRAYPAYTGAEGLL